MLFMTAQLLLYLHINLYHEWEPLPSKVLDKALDGEEPTQIVYHGEINMTVLY